MQYPFTNGYKHKAKIVIVTTVQHSTTYNAEYRTNELCGVVLRKM